MGKHTNIQWCDSTINPTSGCGGCELWHVLNRGPCYAGNLHEGRLAKAMPGRYDASFANVRTIRGRMAEAAGWGDLLGEARPDKPWLGEGPRMIFVGDLGDLFSEGVPIEYLDAEVMPAIASGPGRRHVWQLLTKRPRRFAEYARHWMNSTGRDWPDNLWAGTSVTGSKTAGRIEDLLGVPSRVRFVSFEPLLDDPGDVLLHGIDWAVIGGESRQRGHEPRPFDLAWCRRLLARCEVEDVAAFVKQLGSAPIGVDLADGHGGDWGKWPEDLRVRRMPTPRRI